MVTIAEWEASVGLKINTLCVHTAWTLQSYLCECCCTVLVQTLATS